MFFKAMMTVLLIFLIAGAAAAMGVRVHPEAYSAPDPAGFVEVTFKGGGGSLIGQKTYEDAKGITMTVDGGSAKFSHQDIESVRPLEYKDLPAAEREAFQKPKFLTMRPEDGFFYKPEKAPLSNGGFADRAAATNGPMASEAQPMLPMGLAQAGGGKGTNMPAGVGALQNMIAKQQAMSQYRQEMTEKYAEGMEDAGYDGKDYVPNQQDGEESDSSSAEVDSSINSGFTYNLDFGKNKDRS